MLDCLLQKLPERLINFSRETINRVYLHILGISLSQILTILFPPTNPVLLDHNSQPLLVGLLLNPSLPALKAHLSANFQFSASADLSSHSETQPKWLCPSSQTIGLPMGCVGNVHSRCSVSFVFLSITQPAFLSALCPAANTPPASILAV